LTRILLVGHGSRDDEGNEEFREFVRRLVGQTSYPISSCFLEFAEPDVEQGLAECVRAGATDIVVVPVILLAASHVKWEIPELIDQARMRYPGISIRYGRPVGLHHRIVDLLVARFHQIIEGVEDVSDTAIVLMGRGSSDPDANGDLYKLARILWERTRVMTVETCFTGITDPRLPEGVRRAARLGARRIVVLPYFLFTGVLIKRMTGLLQELAGQYPGIELTMAEYFGFHEVLAQVVRDRIDEAIRGQAAMTCDMCRYRLALVEQGG
jgi:sirohydrochlorin cobaltochelatase